MGTHCKGSTGVHWLQGEYVRKTPSKVLDRHLDWVVFGGNAGFPGANRGAPGFTAVNRFGAGLELPRKPDSGPGEMWRLSFSYLFGTGVRGARAGIGRSFQRRRESGPLRATTSPSVRRWRRC
jgi:hypothetical protein